MFHGTADSMISMQDFGNLAAFELETTKVSNMKWSPTVALRYANTFGSNNYQMKPTKNPDRFTHVLETTTR